MSKKQSSLAQDSQQLATLEQQLKQFRREQAVQCSHMDERTGKHTLRFLNNREDAECNVCKKRFNLEQVKEEDMIKATYVISNAIEQMRFMSNRDSDLDLIVHLGNLNFNLTELTPSYTRVISQFGTGGNKKKKKKGNGGGNGASQFGSFSQSGSVSFVGGGNGGGGNKKNKRW